MQFDAARLFQIPIAWGGAWRRNAKACLSTGSSNKGVVREQIADILLRHAGSANEHSASVEQLLLIG